MKADGPRLDGAATSATLLHAGMDGAATSAGTEKGRPGRVLHLRLCRIQTAEMGFRHP